MSEAVNAGLFHNFRVCAVCGRRLPEAYDEELCPSCKNEQLLHEVKDFIRANDVNEYQVAGHFNIPVSTVKNWIREGRIEYRTKKMADVSACTARDAVLPLPSVRSVPSA